MSERSLHLVDLELYADGVVAMDAEHEKEEEEKEKEEAAKQEELED